MKATLLAALSIGAITKSSLRENILLLTSCSLKMDLIDLYVILFLRVWFFSSTDDIIWPFHTEKKFLWMPLTFDILSINWWITSLYFLTSFLKTGLFWLSILWTFGYELTKLFIINNIKVSCHNMTVMIIYKGIVTFITVTFNWISRSSHEEVFYWKGVALQLYWNCTSAWVFSCIFAAYFQKTFSVEHLWMTASELRSLRNLQIFNWCTNCL